MDRAFSKNTHKDSLQAYLMKTSFELFNGVLGFTVLTHETRIHTNRNESRAYTRLLFRLIAGSRGTLTPSQSARAQATVWQLCDKQSEAAAFRGRDSC